MTCCDFPEIIFLSRLLFLNLIPADSRCYELECDLNLTRQRLEAKQAETQGLEETIGRQGRELTDMAEKVTSVQETANSLKLENGSLKRERDQLIGE